MSEDCIFCKIISGAFNTECVLENEYAVLGFDDHANCFDFMEESNGAHEFKILKKNHREE